MEFSEMRKTSFRVFRSEGSGCIRDARQMRRRNEASRGSRAGARTQGESWRQADIPSTLTRAGKGCDGDL